MPASTGQPERPWSDVEDWEDEPRRPRNKSLLEPVAAQRTATTGAYYVTNSCWELVRLTVQRRGTRCCWYLYDITRCLGNRETWRNAYGSATQPSSLVQCYRLDSSRSPDIFKRHHYDRPICVNVSLAWTSSQVTQLAKFCKL